MIDLERIVGFDWDSGNARKNEKHGVSQSEAEQVFFDPRLLMVPIPIILPANRDSMPWGKRSMAGICTLHSLCERMKR